MSMEKYLMVTRTTVKTGFAVIYLYSICDCEFDIANWANLSAGDWNAEEHSTGGKSRTEVGT